MKVKSRKYKWKTSNQQKMHTRHHQYYNDFSSNLNSTDFYQNNRKVFSKHGYRNISVNKKSTKTNRRKFSPPPVSPILGSEEYMMKKIEQTSAIIMRQLLNPGECSTENVKSSSNDNEMRANQQNHSNDAIIESSINNSKTKNKKSSHYNIEEIQKKILNHITNLNEGKKKNLINCNISGYDAVIEQIQKQKRLEISQALRDVCSNTKQSEESSVFINSIIPDMGIKIEDLPHDLIEKLSNTLSLDLDWTCNDDLYHKSPNDDHCSLENALKKPDSNTHQTEMYIKSESPDFNSLMYIKPEPFNDSIPDGIRGETGNEDISNNLQCKNINSITIDIDSIQKEIDFHRNKTKCLNKSDNEKNLEAGANSYIGDISVEIKNEMCLDPESTCYRNQEIIEMIRKNGNKLNSNELVNPSIMMTKFDGYKENNNKDNLVNHKEVGTNIINSNDKEPIYNTKETKETSICMLNICTQTEEDEICSAEKFIDTLISRCYKAIPKNISEAIDRMCEIDQCVLKLTNYRQSLFTTQNLFQKYDESNTNLTQISTSNNYHGQCPEKKNSSVNNRIVKPKKRKKVLANTCNKKKKKLKSINLGNSIKDGVVKCRLENVTEVSEKYADNLEKLSNINTQSKDGADKLAVPDPCSSLEACRNTNEKYLELLDIHEKILVIKIFEDKLLAGTESGKIIFYSLETGHYSKILHVSNVPITSLLFIEQNNYATSMCVGSLDDVLKIYNFHNCSIIQQVPLHYRVQCMEYNWGHIFIGCIEGNFLRYRVKKKMVEFEDKFSDSSILVLKTAYEGARRVILIGSRNSPVCIRDAMTGLYMRTMENIISPTVYSLILEKSLVYCGTTNHDILVYSFHDGRLIHRYNLTNSKGIGCMKIDRNLLFASCHNGKIYVYDIIKNKFISTIQGPGGVILSMEILENQIIVGTMSFKLISLLIPADILQHKI